LSDKIQDENSKSYFQDYYPERFSHCYGCGKLNDNGLHIKSYWDGNESVATFQPKPYHTALPGFVYGGLIASLIDCHGTGTASAAAYRKRGQEMGTEPVQRYLTGSINVRYLHPTPIDALLELRGTIDKIEERKITVTITVSANEKVCATGEVIAIKVPDHLFN
jgi:acyl-coenzyme A thioesterase PaaI-like protein